MSQVAQQEIWPFAYSVVEILTKLISMNKPEVVFMEPILGALVVLSFSFSYEN